MTWYRLKKAFLFWYIYYLVLFGIHYDRYDDDVRLKWLWKWLTIRKWRIRYWYWCIVDIPNDQARSGSRLRPDDMLYSVFILIFGIVLTIRWWYVFDILKGKWYQWYCCPDTIPGIHYYSRPFCSYLTWYDDDTLMTIDIVTCWCCLIFYYWWYSIIVDLDVEANSDVIICWLFIRHCIRYIIPHWFLLFLIILLMRGQYLMIIRWWRRRRRETGDHDIRIDTMTTTLLLRWKKFRTVTVIIVLIIYYLLKVFLMTTVVRHSVQFWRYTIYLLFPIVIPCVMIIPVFFYKHLIFISRYCRYSVTIQYS